MKTEMKPLIKWFSGIRATDVLSVGGKGASLGEMYSQLPVGDGVPVPNGFVLTTAMFDAFIEENNMALDIVKLVHEFSPDKSNLPEIGLGIRSLIEGGDISQHLEAQITKAYRELSGEKDIDVAVRSTATVEDNLKDSFAGQFETFLNVFGVKSLLIHVRKCWASLFNDEAIKYRYNRGYDVLGIGMAVIVQKMVRSDHAAAGVMFTLDRGSGFPGVFSIQSSYGLGKMVVDNRVIPDTLLISKQTGALIRKTILPGSKTEKMIYSHGRDTLTEVVKTSAKERKSFSISDEEACMLAQYAAIIEKHYGRHMDIEWAKDGVDKKLYIVQARPETVYSNKANTMIREEYTLSKNGERMLVEGARVGENVVHGTVQQIVSLEYQDTFIPGNILVTDMTMNGWESLMEKASAIVTNRGGTDGHTSIIASELGILAVVGCNDATEKLCDGCEVTVSGAEGEIGYVYEGKVPFVKKEVDVSYLQKPKRTKIMLNVADPRMAFSLAVKYGDIDSGVGLLRLELMINRFGKQFGNGFGVHPRAFLEYESLDREMREQIDLLVQGYESPREFFVSQIAQGVATIAASAYPKPTIVRFSDFKTNEYRDMIGGKLYEKQEENPMIGWRGAGRYFSPAFTECFKMECEALRRARYEMGLDNIWVMVPFVRTPITGRRVIELLAENGLRQSDGLKIVCMCEIPANVLDAEELLDIFDGFSFGTNDMKQLFFGFDRDGGMREEGVDDRNPTLLRFMEPVIALCKRRMKYIGVCGDGPSKYKEVVDFFVKCGVDSLSFNHKSVFKMTDAVAQAEKELGL